MRSHSHRRRLRIGPAGRRRRQPRAPAQRTDLRPSLRQCPGRRQLRQERAPPTQPRRRPSGQLSAVADRDDTHRLRPAHQALHRAAHEGGPHEEGSHAVSEALRRPGGVRSSTPRATGLTSLGASFWAGDRCGDRGLTHGGVEPGASLTSSVKGRHDYFNLHINHGRRR